MEQWFLLMSDNHHDSTLCNRTLEKQHLDEALRRGASIFIFGDYFDSMQGHFDPRRNMDELRPEYRRSDYFDFVVEDSAEFLQPYAKNILMIARGNHETAVLKYNNTDLTDRLVYALNSRNKTSIVSGGFGGWIRLMLAASTGVPQGSVKMKYYHGGGGDAPVTRGMIDTNRQAVYLPDADVVINGHNHQAYIIPIARERLSGKGVLSFDVATFVRIPGYKQDYADGSGGWAVERKAPPKPIGCVWMRLNWHKPHNRGYFKLAFEADVQGPEAIAPVMRFNKKVIEYAEDPISE
jgi:predicted phosphodiesterase